MDLFGEHYQVLAKGQKPISCGIVVDTFDAARLFSILTCELIIPAECRRGILFRLKQLPVITTGDGWGQHWLNLLEKIR